MYKLIKKLCVAKGISPTKLCTEITGSKGNLPTWQKGNINPTSLIKIADYFEVSTDYLLGRTDEPKMVNSHLIKTGDIGDNSNNNNNSINISEQKKLDEMSEELLKKFSKLSFDEKLDIFNYIKNKE